MEDTLTEFFSLSGCEYSYSRDGDVVVYLAAKDGVYKGRATFSVAAEDLDAWLVTVDTLVTDSGSVIV